MGGAYCKSGDPAAQETIIAKCPPQEQIEPTNESEPASVTPKPTVLSPEENFAISEALEDELPEKASRNHHFQFTYNSRFNLLHNRLDFFHPESDHITKEDLYDIIKQIVEPKKKRNYSALFEAYPESACFNYDKFLHAFVDHYSETGSDQKCIEFALKRSREADDAISKGIRGSPDQNLTSKGIRVGPDQSSTSNGIRIDPVTKLKEPSTKRKSDQKKIVLPSKAKKRKLQKTTGVSTPALKEKSIANVVDANTLCRLCNQKRQSGNELYAVCSGCGPSLRFVHDSCFRSHFANKQRWWELKCTICGTRFEGSRTLLAVGEKWNDFIRNNQVDQRTMCSFLEGLAHMHGRLGNSSKEKEFLQKVLDKISRSSDQAQRIIQRLDEMMRSNPIDSNIAFG